MPGEGADAVRIGTRASKLALAQARLVERLLRERAGVDVELVPIKTSGDRGVVADKSRFVKEIESALQRGEVDLAVHSAKDVPGVLPEGLEIAGAPPAEDARDALAGTDSLAALSEGARVGTASLRRRSQLLALRPDLDVAELRGNVDTRLAKLAQGSFEAIVLALAGLRRLGLESEVGAVIEADVLVPAPGQGILAIEVRSRDGRATELARAISDAATLARLAAERAVVAALDASCHTPIGAHATRREGYLRVQAYAGLPDGSEWIRDEIEDDGSDPGATGKELAARMRAAGAIELLRRGESHV